MFYTAHPYSHQFREITEVFATKERKRLTFKVFIDYSNWCVR